MSEPVRYTKIKLTDKETKVVLAWEEGRSNPRDEHSLASKDLPRPELQQALAGLVPGVLEICELPESYGQGLIVTGVSLSWSEDDIMGASIIALKTLEEARAPLSLVTPHLPVAPYSEGDIDAPVLSPDVVDALAVLEDEANKYRVGDRAQASLFSEAAAGHGVDEVTVSRTGARGDGVRSVTITKEDAAQMRRNLDRITSGETTA